MIGASTIIAIALIPALKLMRASIKVNREAETANLVSTLAVSKLEEFLVSTASSWSNSNASGHFGSIGHSNLRFEVSRSDLVAEGGIPGDLMSITSTVWEDSNGNGNWDAGEARAVFASKLAHSVSYDREANET